jgi:hypothetical protein
MIPLLRHRLPLGLLRYPSYHLSSLHHLSCRPVYLLHLSIILFGLDSKSRWQEHFERATIVLRLIVKLAVVALPGKQRSLTKLQPLHLPCQTRTGSWQQVLRSCHKQSRPQLLEPWGNRAKLAYRLPTFLQETPGWSLVGVEAVHVHAHGRGHDHDLHDLPLQRLGHAQ